MQNIYSVRDLITGLFGPPVYFNQRVKDGGYDHLEASAWFGHGVLQLPPTSYKKATDFELFHIGVYDGDRGIIAGLPAPVFVLSGTPVSVPICDEEMPK